MNEDVYLKLAERLNEFEHVVPPVPSYIEVLKHYFTEEQAAFASTFPDGQFTLSELAEKLNQVIGIKRTTRIHGLPRPNICHQNTGR